MNYTVAGIVTDMRVTDTPRYGRTVSGYGRKIPTRFMLKYGRSWHRVYVMQYGNAGTCYISTNNGDLALDTDTEHSLYGIRDGVSA